MGILQKRNCDRCPWIWAELPLTLIAASVFQCSHGSLKSEGIDSRCNLYSVTTTGWTLFSVCFLLGKDYADHDTTFLCQTEESATLYKHCIVSEYGHFRLNITGISRQHYRNASLILW